MQGSKKTFLKSQPKNGLTLREMFTRPLIYGTPPSSPKWSTDGKTLAFLWNEGGEPLCDVYISTSSDAKPVRITDAAAISPLPVEDDERPKVETEYAEVMYSGVNDFDWLTKDENVPTSERWIAFLCRGNIFKVSAAGGEPTRLTKTTQGVGNLKVSPDGRKIGFLSGGNIWAYDTEVGSMAQLTFFSKDQVTVNRYEWSPDSKHIGFEVEDRSMFERVKMPDYSPENEVKIIELRRNNVGKPLSKSRIGMVPAEGGKMARVMLPGYSTDKNDTGDNLCIHSLMWTPDSSKMVFAFSARISKDWHIIAVEPGKEDTPDELYKETSEPWFDWSFPQISPDSKYVYFLTYLTNWRQLYRVPMAGGKIEQITDGKFDMTTILIPKKGSEIIFTANWPHPTAQDAYTLPFEGGEPKKISPEHTWSSVIASDDGKTLAFNSSSVMVPAELYWKTESGDFTKLTHSPLPAFEKIPAPQVKRFSFKNETDDAVLSGRMILPHNFDPSKKYPVVMTCIYAGAGKEGFGRYQVLDTYMANEMGYIIVGVDIRATMGYGKDFFFGYHKNLGLIDAEECVSCAKYMKTLPYVDSERVGFWGGSYGGFLVLMVMCNHPGVFHTGISWKPVTDWRNYWDGYTAPRLGRPEDDPEIYKATSPVFHAAGLEGNLLVVHGMLDDNVLFQDAAWMIQRMIEEGKYFDLMIYPRDDHGLTRRHESLPDCMERFAAYFEEHMGLGPIE